MPRRSYGTGSLFARGDRWYGKWRIDGQQTKRLLGPKRQPGSREGLTRKIAEIELRRGWRRPVQCRTPTPSPSRMRRPSSCATPARSARSTRRTLSDYRGVIDGYLLDEFGTVSIAQITPDLIDAYKEKLIADGKLSNRTVVRHLTVLHGVFKRAKRVWGLQENGLG